MDDLTRFEYFSDELAQLTRAIPFRASRGCIVCRENIVDDFILQASYGEEDKHRIYHVHPSVVDALLLFSDYALRTYIHMVYSRWILP